MKKRVEYTWNKITYYMCIRKLYMYITCFRILQNAVHAYPTAHSCIVSLSHSALNKIYMVFNVINNSLLLVHYIFCCVSTSPTWAVNPVILLNSLHMFFIMQLFFVKMWKTCHILRNWHTFPSTYIMSFFYNDKTKDIMNTWTATRWMSSEKNKTIMLHALFNK